MKKTFSKKIGFIIMFTLITCVTLLPNKLYADDIDVDGFNIIPELEDEEINEINQHIEEIGRTGGNVRKAYNEAASGMSTSQQISSGIMNRDTIMNYIVFVIKFLSQLGLVIGVVFIMYAGYKYMLSVFNSGKTPSSTIKNAIIGVIIVIFSYAIMRILTSLIGLT